MASPGPLISVVVPTFNRSALTLQALDSIVRQTYPHWEAVVVDDGSSDDIGHQVSAMAKADPRVRFLSRNRMPKGAATCRNIGLDAARGDYVVFLDSDDLLASRCLENRIKTLLESPEAKFAVFPSLLFRKTITDSMLLWNVATSESDLCRFIRGDSVWPINGPIWRKAALLELGGCDENLVCWQDVDLHLRALLNQPEYVRRLDTEPDGYVRRHAEGSISQGGLTSPEALGSIIRVFEKSCEAITKTLATPSMTEPVRHSTAVALSYILKLSIVNRHFSLARKALAVSRQHQVTSVSRYAAWRFTVRVYQVNLHYLLGGSFLRRMLSVRPRIAPTLEKVSYENSGNAVQSENGARCRA